MNYNLVPDFPARLRSSVQPVLDLLSNTAAPVKGKWFIGYGNIESMDDICRIIELLRCNGHLILGDNGGYYISSDMDKVARYIARRRGRYGRQLRTVNYMDKEVQRRFNRGLVDDYKSREKTY